VIDTVTDDEIVEAYKLVAACEGVFCEPASAASIAGLIKYTKKSYFENMPSKNNIKAVCILTGHGLKDPDRAIACAKKPQAVKAEIKEILKAIGL